MRTNLKVWLGRRRRTGDVAMTTGPGRDRQFSVRDEITVEVVSDPDGFPIGELAAATIWAWRIRAHAIDRTPDDHPAPIVHVRR